MLNVVCRVRRIDSEFNLPFSDCDNPCCNRVPRFCHTTLDLDFSGSTISRPFHPSESFVIKSHQLCFRTVFMLALYIALLVRVAEIISQMPRSSTMNSCGHSLLALCSASLGISLALYNILLCWASVGPVLMTGSHRWPDHCLRQARLFALTSIIA